ncbi:hypothetical protein H3M12_06730 [Levilactobacillus suantsaii]|nr:hypothetical protein [Levilactobacillus suantsaii]QMU07195.1 hypothetical protein H3M12_06730 [Levilactobacillus suantsaii]
MNQLLFFNLLAVVVTMVYQIWRRGFAQLEMISTVTIWGSIFGFVAFVLLARQNEQVVISDTYRLLPTSDTKLYLANLGTSLVALLYVGVIQVILLAVGTAMSGNIIRMWLQLNIHMSAAAWHDLAFYGTSAVLWGIVVALWAWAVITLIHFGTNTISAFLPNVQQRIIKVVLAIILTGVLLRFLTWFAELESKLYAAFTGIASVLEGGVWFDLLGLVVVVIVVATANIVMMHRWVEAKY